MASQCDWPNPYQCGEHPQVKHEPYGWIGLGVMEHKTPRCLLYFIQKVLINGEGRPLMRMYPILLLLLITEEFHRSRINKALYCISTCFFPTEIKHSFTSWFSLLCTHSLLDTKGVSAALGEGTVPRFQVQKLHVGSKPLVNLVIFFSLQVHP